jgi:hypothetical protein
MPDRAIIPLLPALALGFICGIIASAKLLGDSGTLWVGVIGGVAVALVASTSILGVRAEGGEKAIVAGLRIALAVGLYACIYLFILSFLREGSMIAVVWIPFAIFFGVMLGRVQVRDSKLHDAEQGEAA